MPRMTRGPLKLPTPKELGWSEHNALGMRGLTPFQEGPTWEDWEEYVRDRHPVKYFLVETFPKLFRPLQRLVKNTWYWIKCHTLPSHRWHKLDLRGVDPLSDYTHGHMDPCEVMRLGVWAALRAYMEKGDFEAQRRLHEGLTEEEKVDPVFVEQKLQRCDEPKALYDYWMKGRLEEKKEEIRLWSICQDYGKKAREEALVDGDREGYDAAMVKFSDFCQAREQKEEEMFLRLCAIRRHLWY